MKHDQLLALEAIVSTGTFRGAAERLHKSQSAVSHTIRQLEHGLTPSAMRNHFVILGWTNRTPEIIRRLVASEVGAEVEAGLLTRLKGLLGEEAELTIESGRSLPPAPNGKYRLCYRER